MDIRLMDRSFVGLRQKLTVIAATATVFLTGCIRHGGAQNDGSIAQPPSQSVNGSAQVQTSQEGNGNAQAAILAAQQDHQRKVELTVSARVMKKLPDDTVGLPHERFLIELDNGSTVLVAHDTAMAPYVPLHRGDIVRIHGEYIWNKKGGVLHWTHHTDTPRHEGGWIELNGQRYE